MAETKTVEFPVQGMDCAECALHVQHAIEKLPGVASANVLLGAEKAVVRLDAGLVDMPTLRRAVEGAGYRVPATAGETPGAAALAAAPAVDTGAFTRRILTFFALVFGAVLFIVVAGEWLGLFENLTALVPFWLGALLVLASGWPIFANVVRAALGRRVTSHTLMTLGVIAALAVGEWATAAVVVFFMRVGDYAERFTAEGARRAVKELTALSPQTARVARPEGEEEVPIARVALGDIVVVRPGELIPVDGEVVAGHATINQATITGESVPLEAGPGMPVYAATIAQLGSLRIRTTRVGPDTTFGRVVKLVEEAEAHRADVQRFADKFTGYYLPIVGGIALLTFLISRNPLATAAVLVVACSCSIALATPIAMLASIGGAARRGLLIKGGKYLETLAHADVLLIDKTGTLTLGAPQITDIVPLNGLAADAALRLAASAERYSEHPLAAALRAAAADRGLALSDPQSFTAVPGIGVQATVDAQRIEVGSGRLVAVGATAGDASLPAPAAALVAEGKTLLYMARDGAPAAVFGAADTLRPEVPAALQQLGALGIRHVELLTGDNARTAAALAAQLGIAYRADLLPEDKIAVVKEYQARGHTVVMVGDGVNDAPALAQADVGIAMGAAGADVALEAAHIALMRSDWQLVPEVLGIAQRTMRVVKMNLAFTGVYNVVGLSLAAFGLLPPMLAAAAQSIPDLGILANSARLLRQKPS
jgi:Cd2+/Zn2+-exporting ATPase/Cu+-exporting ATPase